MARPPAQAELMLIEEGLELLTEDECHALLLTEQVGRVGLSVAALPAIFPVSYRIVDGAILFRTSPGSKLSAAAKGTVVAFEVDDYQVDERCGWSVLVVGKAEIVQDFRTAFRALEAHLDPLVGGPRDWIVRIEPTLVTGRRIARPRSFATKEAFARQP